MTIRLRCAACNRKLKVPDEALGKKVQCPMCNARFIGRVEPPLAPEPTAPLPPPLADAPLVDSIFAELTSPALNDNIASTPLESLQNREREESSLKADSAVNEPLEPMIIEDEAGMEIVEEAIEDEPPTEVVEESGIEEITEEDEEVVDDIGEEEKVPARAGKSQRGKKKSSKFLVICLGAVAALLLGCGGIGFVIWHFFLDNP